MEPFFQCGSTSECSSRNWDHFCFAFQCMLLRYLSYPGLSQEVLCTACTSLPVCYSRCTSMELMRLSFRSFFPRNWYNLWMTVSPLCAVGASHEGASTRAVTVKEFPVVIQGSSGTAYAVLLEPHDRTISSPSCYKYVPCLARAVVIQNVM